MNEKENAAAEPRVFDGRELKFRGYPNNDKRHTNFDDRACPAQEYIH